MSEISEASSSLLSLRSFTLTINILTLHCKSANPGHFAHSPKGSPFLHHCVAPQVLHRPCDVYTADSRKS